MIFNYLSLISILFIIIEWGEEVIVGFFGVFV